MARSRTKPLVLAAPKRSSLVRLAMKMIESPPCEGLTVKRILRRTTDIPSKLLERDFKAQLGKMPGQMLKLVRLNRAKGLLHQHGYADQAGRPADRFYQRASNFCDFFLTNTGKSPSEFRTASRRRIGRPTVATSGSVAAACFDKASTEGCRSTRSPPAPSGMCPTAWISAEHPHGRARAAMPQVDAKPELISFRASQFTA